MSDAQPRFSVIIPAYNRAHLIGRCLDSVLGQTWADWEAIVADDGSKDDTEQVVSEYSGRDRRIQYRRQENRGAGAARNLGARASSGQYLVFLDSDDEAVSEWLALFAEAIDEQQADIVCCGCDLVRMDGSLIRTRLPNPADRAIAFQRGYFFTGTFAVRREIFFDVGGYSDTIPANQHSELRMRLLPQMDQRDWKLACVARPLVKRFLHDGPSIRSNARAVLESGEFILGRYSSVLKEDPRSFASWATAVGAAAAALRSWPTARHWFRLAVQSCPRDTKNWLRWLLTWLPGLRDRVWSQQNLGVPRS